MFFSSVSEHQSHLSVFIFLSCSEVVVHHASTSVYLASVFIVEELYLRKIYIYNALGYEKSRLMLANFQA